MRENEALGSEKIKKLECEQRREVEKEKKKSRENRNFSGFEVSDFKP
jgi:hypothetical protein